MGARVGIFGVVVVVVVVVITETLTRTVKMMYMYKKECTMLHQDFIHFFHTYLDTPCF
jgi:hypothetical protein